MPWKDFLQKFAKGADEVEEGSKAAKALEQGYSKDVYLHGTQSPGFAEFKSSNSGMLGPGVYVTKDPETASHYAGGENKWSGAVMPLKVQDRFLNELEPLTKGEAETFSMVLGKDVSNLVGRPKRELVNTIPIGNADPYSSSQKTINDQLQRLGYSGRTGGDKVSVVFKPEDVRSTYAEFDSAQKGKKNILGGIAAGASGAALAKAYSDFQSPATTALQALSEHPPEQFGVKSPLKMYDEEVFNRPRAALAAALQGKNPISAAIENKPTESSDIAETAMSRTGLGYHDPEGEFQSLIPKEVIGAGLDLATPDPAMATGAKLAVLSPALLAIMKRAKTGEEVIQEVSKLHPKTIDGMYKFRNDLSALTGAKLFDQHKINPEAPRALETLSEALSTPTRKPVKVLNSEQEQIDNARNVHKELKEKYGHENPFLAKQVSGMLEGDRNYGLSVGLPQDKEAIASQVSAWIPGVTPEKAAGTIYHEGAHDVGYQLGDIIGTPHELTNWRGVQALQQNRPLDKAFDAAFATHHFGMADHNKALESELTRKYWDKQIPLQESIITPENLKYNYEYEALNKASLIPALKESWTPEQLRAFIKKIGPKK